MIRKIVNAVLGKNNLVTALLYTGLALSLFAMTPSQAGITNAGEEDSSIFDLLSCYICGSSKVYFTHTGQSAVVTIDGTVRHGTWQEEKDGYPCTEHVILWPGQRRHPSIVRCDFREYGSPFVWNAVVPDAFECKNHAK